MKIYCFLKSHALCAGRQVYRTGLSTVYVDRILKHKVRGKIEFQGFMQGKKSLVREALVVRIKAVRGQISSFAALKPNQVIFPITKADEYQFGNVNLLPLDGNDTEIHEEKYFSQFSSRTLIKSNPTINGASVSAHDEIAFSRSNFISVGLADLEPKIADFDGQTESAFILTDEIRNHQYLKYTFCYF